MTRPGRGVRGPFGSPHAARGGHRGRATIRGVGVWAPGAGLERGSATAELAVGLPAVLLLLFVGLTAVGAVTTKLECVDAARQAALAASRGESGAVAGQRAAPDGAEVSVVMDGDTVVATVRAPVPLLGARLPAISVEDTAVAAREPGIAP